MRRNSTLPSIKQAISQSLNKSKEQQTVRKIQSKINNHDEQILRNDKVISNLANDFRLLKQQLDFQQTYNQKYKTQMIKYQDDIGKYQKVIKEQRNMISKLQKKQKEKDELIKQLQNKAEENRLKDVIQQKINQIFLVNNKIKGYQFQQEKSLKQMQKMKRELKNKQNELKIKQQLVKKQFQQQKQGFLAKIKKLEHQLNSLSVYQQNSKQMLDKKDKQILKLSNQLQISEERVKSSNKNDIKSKNLMEEMKLYNNQILQWKNKCKQLQTLLQSMQNQIKANEDKLKEGNHQKIKKIELEKKQLKEKLEKVHKEFQSYKMQKEIEKQDLKVKKDKEKEDLKAQKDKEKEDFLKRQNSAKKQAKQKLTKLQNYYEKSIKLKGQVNKQLQKLKGNIMCDFCNKLMKNPVTNIPCGHSYCQECKAGYLKECKKCGSGAKREAVYRNELLDEIILATNIIQKISSLFQN